jgi:hypothetical protein
MCHMVLESSKRIETRSAEIEQIAEKKRDQVWHAPSLSHGGGGGGGGELGVTQPAFLTHQLLGCCVVD